MYYHFIVAIFLYTISNFEGNYVLATEKNKEMGGTFQDCDVCPKLSVIPSGTFIMGSKSKYKHEKPAHKVTIAKPFAIGIYEVTFDEWEACFKAGGCQKIPDDHNWGRGKRPVINITWQETKEYLAWLSKKTTQKYRLPSEAEWEYAARGGTTTEFSWGNEVGENNANCRDCKSKWSKKSSAPVGSFSPNPFGLYDVHGNEWEWMEDCWSPNGALPTATVRALQSATENPASAACRSLSQVLRSAAPAGISGGASSSLSSCSWRCSP